MGKAFQRGKNMQQTLQGRIEEIREESSRFGRVPHARIRVNCQEI